MMSRTLEVAELFEEAQGYAPTRRLAFAEFGPDPLLVTIESGTEFWRRWREELGPAYKLYKAFVDKMWATRNRERIRLTERARRRRKGIPPRRTAMPPEERKRRKRESRAVWAKRNKDKVSAYNKAYGAKYYAAKREKILAAQRALREDPSKRKRPFKPREKTLGGDGHGQQGQ